MDRELFKGKNILVMGLGRFGGGVDSAIFAHRMGSKVTVTDIAEPKELTDALEQLSDHDIEYHLGGHRAEDFKKADIIIVNPVVAPQNSFLQIARNENKIITSQIEIFFELCPARIVGITGANGKSTTTALTSHLLCGGIGQEDVDYKNVFLGGNIGNKPLLSRLDQIQPEDVVVLEISSFQVDQLCRIQKGPDVAVITNVTPNHLDRYGSFEAYCQSKENIFKLQRPKEDRQCISIFNTEDPITAEWYDRYNKEADRSCLKFSVEDVPKELAEVFTIPGRMNLSNLAASLLVARYFRVSNERITQAVGTFKALPCRLELVAKIEGVCWYNDSIATTPVSAIAAIEAFTEPKIIIAGGYDKGLGFDEFGKAIAHKAKAAVLIGKTARSIVQAIQAAGNENTKVQMVSSMAEAVNCADGFAENGDVVLLTPGCASYDMFKNFQHRGQVFCELVENLRT